MSWEGHLHGGARDLLVQPLQGFFRLEQKVLKPGLVDLEQVSSLTARFGLLSLVLLPDMLQHEKKGGEQQGVGAGGSEHGPDSLQNPTVCLLLVIKYQEEKKIGKMPQCPDQPPGMPGEGNSRGADGGCLPPAPPRLAGLGRLRSAGNAQEPAEQRERELGRGRR